MSIAINPAISTDDKPSNQDMREVASETNFSQVSTSKLSCLLNENLYSPLKISALASVLLEAGYSAEEIFLKTNLTLPLINNPGTLSSIQQLIQIGKNAVRLTQNMSCPTTRAGNSKTMNVGLLAGLRMHVSAYGMYGYALQCKATMRDAFNMAVNCQSLATPVMPIRWVEQENRAMWILPRHEELHFLNLSAAEYRLFLDMQFMIHVTLIKDAMGADCKPVSVKVSYPEPPDRADYEQIFECPFYYLQERNELHYSRHYLDMAPAMANPIAATQMSLTCAELLNQMQFKAGMARRVYEELIRHPGKFADIESLAQSINMGERTLRRKLKSEGTSYTQLLTNVRHALALDYLKMTRLSLEDIAAALGFSDASSFGHAFKKWTGDSPNTYRDKLQRQKE
ncbi:MAG: AraC family transcriptional regulator [Burkholderiales bacterium]